jgi:hypothetical protein
LITVAELSGSPQPFPDPAAFPDGMQASRPHVYIHTRIHIYIQVYITSMF